MEKMKLFLIALFTATIFPINLSAQNVLDGLYVKDDSMDSVVISVKDLKSFNYIIKNVNNSADMLNEALKKSISYNMYLLGNMQFYRSGKKGKGNAKILEYALKNYSDSMRIFQEKSLKFNKIALSRYDSLAEKEDFIRPR